MFKTQFLSLGSNGLIFVLGILQTVIVIKILSIKDYGIVGLAVAVGGIIGILHHLGLIGAMTREMSVQKTPAGASKVLFSALFVRMITSVLLALVIYFMAPLISLHLYHQPKLLPCLKIFALVIIFQGVAEVLDGSILGLQKFNSYFITRLVLGGTNLALFTLLVYHYRINGYFYALLTSSLLRVGLDFILIHKHLKSHFILPAKNEFSQILKQLFQVGLTVYGIKIGNVILQKAGILILGLYASVEMVGQFNFVMSIGAKLMVLSSAITLINVPFMSKIFSQSKRLFAKTFKTSFNQFFLLYLPVIILILSVYREIFELLFGFKYHESFAIFPIIIFMYYFLSISTFVASGFIVPGSHLKGVFSITIFSRCLGVLLIWLWVRLDFGIMGAALGTLLGVIPSLLKFLHVVYQKSNILVFDRNLQLLFMIFIPNIVVGLFFNGYFLLKIMTLALSFTLYIWTLYRTREVILNE